MSTQNPQGARPGKRVRVLVAEDSPVFAEALCAALETDPEIEVAGRADNGRRAVELAERLRPDLIIMDVRMPVMDGLHAIEAIMARCPTPILVMTSDPQGESGELALEAIRRGALELATKGVHHWSSAGRRELCVKVKFLASVPVVRHAAPPGRAFRQPDEQRADRVKAVGIVASTGGPVALAQILAALPKELESGILVVQHLAEGFSGALVSWLAGACRLRVETARQGETLGPGCVLVAPDDRHLLVDVGRRIVLTDNPPLRGHRPSGDLMLESLAEAYGHSGLGVVLTGMGEDGAIGLLAVRKAGGRTLAQDEQTSLIFGMPRAAWESGAAERQVPLGEIAGLIRRMAGGRGSS